MSTRVLTLFGEEMIPEQMNAVGRPAKTKKNQPAQEEQVAETPETETPESESKPDEQTAIAATDGEIIVLKEGAPLPVSPDTQGIAAQPVKKEAVKAVAAEKEVKKDFLEGWDAQKQYYTIGEVAALFSVKTSNIRFWTNEFALKVRTTRKGDRLYTPEQVREIRNIYYLVKEKRYTISGAKAKLKEKTVPTDSIDLKKALLHLRNKLLTIRNQLT